MSQEHPRALIASAFPNGAPRLGFGSGDLFGSDRSSLSTSRAVVEAAFDAGFRYFDTARLYGNGSAERVLGDVLARRRSEIVLASKVGIIPWSMQLSRRIMRKAVQILRKGGPAAQALIGQPPEPAAEFGAFLPSQIRHSVETSLRMLKTDHLDILLLHECTTAEAMHPRTVEVLDRLKQEGKTRFLGIATSLGETVRILDRDPAFIDVVQAPADAAGQQWSSYRVGSDRCLVTHSALRPVLFKVADRARADQEFAARFKSLTGVEPTDTTPTAVLLIAYSLHLNNEGVTLFSTRKPDRLIEMREALVASSFNSSQFAGLEQALRDFQSSQTSPGVDASRQ